MNFSADTFKDFSHHLVTRTFQSLSERLLLNVAAQPQKEYCAWSRILYSTLLSESMEIISHRESYAVS